MSARAGAKHRRPTRYELAKDDPWPFWDRVLIGDGCWEWQGAKGTFGYGAVNVWPRRQMTAHRRAWELWHGPIPEGAHVLHRCDNPPCVRPDHLFLGAPADNVDDMIAKGRRGTPRPFARSTKRLQPCGTPAAYQRHRVHGEVACAPCRAAHAAYQLGRRRLQEV